MDSKTQVITAVDNVKQAGIAAGHDVNTVNVRESLSALMDGEADELELRRILRALPDDPELSAAWQRYHTVRASLHNDIHSRPAVNLLAGINARLAVEADPLPMRGKIGRSGIVRYLGQGAIAASVALAALLSISMLQNGGSDAALSNNDFADATPGPSVDTPVLNGDYTTTASELARTVSTDPDALERLEQAVLREFGEVRATEEIPLDYSSVLPIEQNPAE